MKEENDNNGNFCETDKEQRDRSLFDNIAFNYSKKDRSNSAKVARKHRLQQTLSVLPNKSNLRILEVGCGCGYSAEYLNGMYSHFTGIDYANNLIEYAQKYNKRENTEFIAVNINDYKPKEKYDVIILIGVLHHFDDYKKTFNRLLRFLQLGGHVLINEPQSANILIQFTRKIRTIIDKNYSKEQLTFSENDLSDLYKENELENCKIIPQGLFSTPFAEVVFKPDIIFKIISKFAVFFDKIIEYLFGKLLKYFSWNLIAVGHKKMHSQTIKIKEPNFIQKDDAKTTAPYCHKSNMENKGSINNRSN